MLSQHQALIYGSATHPPTPSCTRAPWALWLSVPLPTKRHRSMSRPIPCLASSANSGEQTQTVKELALGQLALLFKAGACPLPGTSHTVPGEAAPAARPAGGPAGSQLPALPCRLRRGPVHKPAQLVLPVLALTIGQREPQRQREHQPLRLWRRQLVIHPLSRPEPRRYWPRNTVRWGGT